jgi:peptidoglycan/xylan/chitin deacetylase (PgdA/CDA1 family)
VIHIALQCLSPGGARARLSILIFHRVLPEPDALIPDEPDQKRFEQELGWISSWFDVLPLDEAAARLSAGTLPPRAAAITFDDGYADNATVALPVLQHAGLSATFFIATSFLDGGRMWNDTVIESVRACRAAWLDLGVVGLGQHALDSMASRRQAVCQLLAAIKYLSPAQREAAVRAVQAACGERLPDDLMMRSDQVRALRQAGMQIGAHTRSHPILTRLRDDAAYTEILGSKHDLEALLGEPVTLFAYPNGKPGVDYGANHARMVREAGFTAAVSTAPGAASASSDRLQLPRFSPWDRGRARYGMRLLANLRAGSGLSV